MLGHIFEDGTILCIPENSIEYIRTFPKEKGWPMFDKNGNTKKKTIGEMLYMQLKEDAYDAVQYLRYIEKYLETVGNE